MKVLNLLLAIILAVGLFLPFNQPAQATTSTLYPSGEGNLTGGSYTGGDWTVEKDSSDATYLNYAFDIGSSSHNWEFDDFSGPGNSIINSVTVYARIHVLFNASNYSYITYNGTSIGSGHGWNAGFTTYSATASISTIADLDAAKFGVYSNGSDGKAKLVSDMWVVVDYTVPTAPIVTTQAVSSITSTTATGNGNVTSDSGSAITERGTVYNTTVNPDTATGTKDTSAGTTGAFTTSIDTLTKGTLYHVRAYAINAIGTSYGADVEFTTIDNPAIITAAATSVTVTTARLQSYLVSSGGEICTVRFGWGTLDAADNITAYQHYSSFSGTWDTGSSPYLNIDSLASSTLYYFNVEASNVSASVGNGTSTSFTTSNGITAPTNVVALPTGTAVSLSWAKGSETPQTVIRYAVNSCPTSSITGYLLYTGMASTYVQTGLTPGTDYCYWLAGYDTVLGYSATAVTIHATTSSEGTTTGFMENDTNLPVGFIADPTASALADKNPADYIARQNAAAIQMPIDFYYPVMAFFAIIILAFVAFRISKEPIAPSVVACLLLGAFGWPNIIPGWIALILILLIIGINILRMRQVV